MSYVEESIRDLSENHSMDLEGGVDHPKKVRGICRLASGIEATFINVFSNYVYQYLNNPNPYHNLFYVPSRKAENKVGYDLSFGYYQKQSRVRTMHKVVYEQWCDQPWEKEWSFSPRGTEELRGDNLHLYTLISHYREYHQLVPFLVLHVCYCIHDYRRMGFQNNDRCIPSFDSLLRTIIIPLSNISDHLGENLFQEEFQLVIKKITEEIGFRENPNDYFSRIGRLNMYSIIVNGEPVDQNRGILTMSDFCASLNPFLNRAD